LFAGLFLYPAQTVYHRHIEKPDFSNTDFSRRGADMVIRVNLTHLIAYPAHAELPLPPPVNGDLGN
jgi:hypothetical protein